MKRIPSILAALLIMVLVLAVSANNAQAASAGNFTYSVSNGNATITGYTGTSTVVTIPSSIDGYPVVAIGNYAFKDNIEITSVTIPASVTAIGDYYGESFAGCKRLATVTFKEGTSAALIESGSFKDCIALKTVVIPKNYTEIHSSAFSGCQSLTSVTIQGGFQAGAYQTIGSSAFANCPALTKVTMSSVKSIGSSAFSGDTALNSVTLNEGMTFIGNYAFQDDIGLTSVTIPSTITAIGDYYGESFAGCKRLATVTFKEGTSAALIESGSFKNCIALQTVVIPKNYTEIHSSAFSGCQSLTSVTIQGGFQAGAYQTIGSSAFANCPVLTKVTMSSVKSIGSSAFSGDTALNSLALNEGLTFIGNYAFQNDTGLTSVTIPSTVTAIGDYYGESFAGCSKLATVTFKEGASEALIESGSFKNCIALQTVVIPKNYTEIHSSAFSDCKSLTSVTIQGGFYVIPYQEISTSVFNNCAALKTVSLTTSVKSIGNSAFGGSTAVADVYFNGSKSDRDNISISGTAGLTNAVWHYNSGAALTITTQPASVSVTEGSTATFKVVASGSGLTYQWQWRASSTDTWANCSSATTGYNTATLKPVGTAARNGYQYRCVVKDSSGKSVTSNAATLKVLAITSQPASVSVTEGSTATFKVVALNAASYQWQWRASSTGTWANCSSATTGYNTAALKPVGTATRNGYQYRCVVKDSSGKSVTSNTATLTVKAGLAITTQPASTTVTAGNTASFKVVASGSGLTYQWQWRASSTGTWANCSSATTGYNTATLKPVGTAARNGYQYRCIIVDVNGKSATSNAATLTVKAGLAITTQPASTTVTAGSTASFKVVASGSGLTYQWQWRASATGTWANCSSTTTGYNTATLKPVGTAARNGYQYRCIIIDADGNSATSNAVTLTVKEASGATITTQPASTTVTEGSTATFKVVASGSSLTYQWQWRAGASGTWAACSSTTSGYNTATLKPVGTAARNGYQYRCVIVDANGKTAISNVVTLTVKAASGVSITTQPASVTVTEGSTATFKVVATGASSYQWQWRAGASGTWANCSSATSGYNTATLKPVGTAARNGYQYRCIVKDASGNSVTSGVATLTVQ